MGQVLELSISPPPTNIAYIFTLNDSSIQTTMDSNDSVQQDIFVFQTQFHGMTT